MTNAEKEVSQIIRDRSEQLLKIEQEIMKISKKQYDLGRPDEYSRKRAAEKRILAIKETLANLDGYGLTSADKERYNYLDSKEEAFIRGTDKDKNDIIEYKKLEQRFWVLKADSVNLHGALKGNALAVKAIREAVKETARD